MMTEPVTTPRALPALVACLVLSAPDATGNELSGPWPSERGYFAVTIESRLDPVVINRMHAWEVTVNDPEGQSIDDAQLVFSGGMPEHDHGLPTSPQMTERLGGGCYLIEGIRFHMSGRWRLVLEIRANGQQDTVVISTDL